MLRVANLALWIRSIAFSLGRRAGPQRLQSGFSFESVGSTESFCLNCNVTSSFVFVYFSLSHEPNLRIAMSLFSIPPPSRSRQLEGAAACCCSAEPLLAVEMHEQQTRRKHMEAGEESDSPRPNREFLVG